MEILSKIKTYTPPLLLGLILLLSLFIPASNKFDICERFDLVLILGCLTLLIVFFLIYENLKKEHGIFRSIFKKQPKNEAAYLETFLLLGFLIFSILSLYFSTAKTFGLSEILVLASSIAIYLSIARREIKWKENFIKFIVGLGLLNALVAFYIYFVREESRMAGLFYNPEVKANFWPNAFALFLLMVFPLALYLFIRKWTFVRGAILAIIGAVLVLTFSRAAFLVLCIQLGIVFIYFFKRINRDAAKKFIAVILFCVFLIVTANSVRSLNNPVNSFQEKVQFMGTERLTSVQERLDFWKGAVNLSNEKPVFGWGPLSFRFIYPMIQERLLAFSDHPHNWFLKISSERGIPALSLFLLFLVLIFHTIRVRFKNLPIEEKDFVFFTSMALFGTILHNMVDFNLNFITNFLLFWILLGLVRSSVLENTKFSLNSALVPLVLAILITVVSLTEGYYTYFEKLGWKELSNGNLQAAEANFKKYEKTFFPRYFHLKFAEKLLAKREYEKAEKEILKHLHLSPNDALAWSRLGGILRLNFENSRALIAYQYAILNSPKNGFWDYLNYLQILYESGETAKIKEEKENLLKLLDEYLPLVKQNVHFTAWTDIPNHAIAIYEILGKVDPGRKAEFDKKSEEILGALETYRRE